MDLKQSPGCTGKRADYCRIKAYLQDWYEKNKKMLLVALACTFLWGMLAHGYCFFDNSFSHDSLSEFHGAIFGNGVKMGAGRVFTPLYRDLLRGDATVPWLIGMLALLWMGVTSFFTYKVLDIDSKAAMILTAGVLTVNVTVSATAASFLHDLDCYMFALLFAVLAVYCWKTLPWGEIPGAVLIMGSLGIYQGFLTVTIVLVMFVSILALFRGDSFEQVLVRGLRAVGMVLLGGALYYVAMKVMLSLSGMALNTSSYNSPTGILELTPQTLLEFTKEAYVDWFRRIWNAYSNYPASLVRLATVLLFAITGLAMAVFFLDRQRRLREKMLALVLFALLPLMMNLYCVLMRGGHHELTVYAIWLFYLLVMLLADWLVKQWANTGKKEKFAILIRILCFLLVFVMVYGSVQFANGMYLKKDIEYDAYLSLMTRVMCRMESMPDYVGGQTPVVFVGLPETLHSATPGLKDYWGPLGMWFSDVITMPKRYRYQAYFDYVLNTPINLVEEDTWNTIAGSGIAAQMPCYPDEGFLRMEGDTLIVKLGTLWE